jgi:hypothetical protein
MFNACIGYVSCGVLHEYPSTRLQQALVIMDSQSALLVRYNEGLLHLQQKLKNTHKKMSSI